jgi:hypothetical protein
LGPRIRPSGSAHGWATIPDLAKGAWLILCVVTRRRLQLLNNAKTPNNKFVDLESTDSCPADRQATNSESAVEPFRYGTGNAGKCVGIAAYRDCIADSVFEVSGLQEAD